LFRSKAPDLSLFLEHLERHAMPAAATPRHREAPRTGYSLAGLIRSRLRDPSLAITADEGQNELRISDAILAKVPEHLRGPAGALALPYQKPQAAIGQDVNDFRGGGALSPTRLDLADVLRPELSLQRLGARRIELQDGWAGRTSVAASRVTAGWSDPTTGATVPATEFSLATANARPRELSVEIELSRLLLKQGPRTEGLVRELFRTAIEAEHERATVSGTGNNGQPLGLTALGECGVLQRQPVAGSLPTYQELTGGLQRALDSGAHLRRSGFLLPLADNDDLLLLERRPGTPALVERPDGGWLLAGRPAEFSPFVPSGKAIAGEFAELEITYQGAPMLLVNPYTKANQSITRLSIFDYMDSVVRRPQLLTLIG
jgi:HK97 family phage major capsid protein